VQLEAAPGEFKACFFIGWHDLFLVRNIFSCRLRF
jgi:hypothetical protein